MKIRVFLLKSKQNRYAERLAPELRRIFAAYLTEEDGVMAFASVREAAQEIKRAFTDSHAVLFFAEPALYAESKQALAASVGLQLRCDRNLFEGAAASARSAENENSSFAVTHAWMPETARPIVCADWLYAGFSVTSGNQTVMLLPLERGRTEVLLRGSVLPMLNSAYHLHLSMDALRKYHAERLAEVCEANDAHIAVAGTNAADYFRNYIAADRTLSDRVVFAEKAEKRGSLPPADYVVNLSITAAEFFGAPYGVAISNAFYAGDDPSAEKIIYLAITNEHETALREVRSVPGEDVPTLLSRCCGDLCTFIADIAGTDAERRAVSEKNKKSLVSQYRRVIAVVLILIAALAAFCGYYFKQHGYSLQTWAADAWSVVFPGSKPIFQSQEQTEAAAAQTEDGTVPAEATPGDSGEGEVSG